MLLGDLHLTQVPDPGLRSSLGHTLDESFILPLEAGPDSLPDTVSISRWTEGESYRHVQFVTGDGITFTLEATGADGNAVTQNDFIIIGLDRRDATSDLTIDLTQALYQRVENFRGAQDYDNIIIGNELNNNLVGGSHRDEIRSGTGDDYVLAGGGDDVLYGDGGNNHLNGGEGNDLFYLDADHNTVVGGGGNDTVDYSALSSDVKLDVDLQLGVTLKTNARAEAQVELLSSIENAISSNQDAILRGSEADNLLTGGSGNDRLTGHEGKDTLTGGAGEDTFFFTTASAGTDIIADFEVGIDTLDVIEFKLGASDINALIAGAQQSGADVLLTFGDNLKVHLQGVQTTALSIDSFAF